MEKRRRRFGDRKDGRRLRTLSAMHMMEPFIMKERNDALNYISLDLDVTNVSKYVNEKKKQGYPGFSIMYVLIATYIRAVSQKPAINRFVAGQRIFSRDYVEIAITIKKEMNLESPDTVIKVKLPRDATAIDVYEAFEKEIKGYREKPESNFDSVVRILTKIPRPILRGVVRFLFWLDYHGWIPKFLTDLSPFHASMFITSMGSLGIPAIFHHLYNFGNVPIFIAFGKKKFINEVEEDGSVKRTPYVDFNVVMDERICDGYYFASALKYMKTLLKRPQILDEKPEIIEDVE